jgi:hypothetical protein
MHKPLKGSFNEILAVALSGGKDKFMANEAQRPARSPAGAKASPTMPVKKT